MPDEIKPPLSATSQPSPEEVKLTQQVAMLTVIVAAMVRVFPRDAMGFHDHLLQAIGEVAGDLDAKNEARAFFNGAFGGS